MFDTKAREFAAVGLEKALSTGTPMEKY